MGEIRENVKKNLVYYLSLKGIKQKELSDKLSVSQSAVTNWIKGRNSPDIEIVARICEILDISVINLFSTTPETIEKNDHNLSELEKGLLLKYNTLPPSEQKIVDEVVDALLVKHSQSENSFEKL